MLMILYYSVKSIAEVKTIINNLNVTCSRFGLFISFPKTKTQVFKSDELASLSPLFSINESLVNNVLVFAYLGQTFISKNQGSFTDLRM